ncbi:thiamine pyrophosphate-dependent enzyme [Granulicella tundricola]|uniref:Thiamine pyrophosphate central domain-containing protein n=1 Tax=Granulicella tundricola (strain ATCC BAA-1859 / DSM 23138 / MP5ACTX9) TaxID=1198114 RepID=E8X750_GRATM|nr:thiamine pyrophosphate-dependent enzyme [Granulicella tundricola]ADW71284.1 thiamine pyrophosphate central domain-containing protein [Granulicella tundricola MP5ACTX9]
MNASDVLVERLLAWGVDTFFGLPGDGINGVMESLRKAQDKIRFIHVRHEESAAFMACAYAKFTGRLGVCLATSGPGGIHLLNGLYDAKMDQQPVLAITGMQFTDVTNTFGQQDVELDKLFMDVCVYNTRVMSASHMEPAADLAVRTAIMKRGVAHLTIPIDIQIQDVKIAERSDRNVAHHTSTNSAISGNLPQANELKLAADLINHGKRIAIMAGQGALHATDELLQLAELMGAPIIKPLLGKGVIPDESPYTTGGIGLLGTKPSQDVIENCDTLIMVGTSYPYMEYLPKPGDAKCIQIDANAQRIGLRYPADVGLVGDSKKTLQMLLPMLKKNSYRKFLERAQEDMKDWIKTLEKEGTNPAKPMKPQVVGWELGKRAKENAIIVSDSGTNTTVWARYMLSKQGQQHSCSGNLATMACGMPYAIAAQVAFPDRQVIGVVGDGGFTMLMGEIITAVTYKLPIKLVIIKNNTLGQIKWEQMVFEGNPEYQCDLLPIDFVALARAVGAEGVRIDDQATAGEMLDKALAMPGPVIIEAVVDPFTAMLPPKITPTQALHFSESLMKGEPNRMKIALTAASDTVRQII